MNCKYFSAYLLCSIRVSKRVLLCCLAFLFIKLIDITDSGNICCHLQCMLRICFGAVCWLVLDHRSDCSDDLSHLSLHTESTKSFQFCKF